MISYPVSLRIISAVEKCLVKDMRFVKLLYKWEYFHDIPGFLGFVHWTVNSMLTL